MIQKMKNRKGFTLIEMLVVIAIIAVLVAIVIPVVGDSTEKAREAADAANIRSAIAVVTTKALTGDTDATETVELTQDGDFDKAGLTDIGGYEPSEFAKGSITSKTYTITVSWDATKSEIVIGAPTAKQ